MTTGEPTRESASGEAAAGEASDKASASGEEAEDTKYEPSEEWVRTNWDAWYERRERAVLMGAKPMSQWTREEILWQAWEQEQFEIRRAEERKKWALEQEQIQKQKQEQLREEVSMGSFDRAKKMDLPIEALIKTRKTRKKKRL